MTHPLAEPARPQAGQPPSAPPGGGFAPTRGRGLPLALANTRGGQSTAAPVVTDRDRSPFGYVSTLCDSWSFVHGSLLADKLPIAPFGPPADGAAPTPGHASSLRTRRDARHQGTAA